MSPGRTAALSDGIIAIAATLLVLEIHPPDPASPDIWRALADEWPSYLAYVISFLTIGIIWVNHHRLLDAVVSVDQTLLFLNLLLMMVVAFIPFPTGFLAQSFREGQGESAAAVLYGAVLLAIGCVFALTWLYLARTTSLLIDPGRSRTSLRRSLTGPVAYAIAILTAFFTPLLSVALYAAIALYFVRPGWKSRPAEAASSDDASS